MNEQTDKPAEPSGVKLVRREFQPGETIFLEGNRADCAWLVESGFVEIFRRAGKNEMIIASVGRGGILGEMALIDRGNRSASARAVEKSVLVGVPVAAFDKRLTDADPVLRRILEKFSQIIRNLTKENTELRSQISRDR